jgi:hypothetical protein
MNAVSILRGLANSARPASIKSTALADEVIRPRKSIARPFLFPRTKAEGIEFRTLAANENGESRLNICLKFGVEPCICRRRTSADTTTSDVGRYHCGRGAIQSLLRNFRNKY